MAAKRDAPELWEQQEGEKSQHYQKFCQYRDMPYGTQGREVLIETLWNVNNGDPDAGNAPRVGFNRNIVECKFLPHSC